MEYTVFRSNYASIFVFSIAIYSYMTLSLGLRPLPPKTSTEFIRTSCRRTTYPDLCYSSLSRHASLIQTDPKLLTSAALNVTLDATRSTSATMVRLAKTHGMSPREVGAMKDCVEELGASVNELRKSIGEMKNIRSSNFELTINDIQTWVSAAMTDETTCSDGFAGNVMNGNVKVAVRNQIVTIAHLTSNALALINKYASLHG